MSPHHNVDKGQALSPDLTALRNHIQDIGEASDDLAQLATFMRWAGVGVRDGAGPHNSIVLSELGCAMVWAGRMIDERCAVISEAVSKVDVDSARKSCKKAGGGCNV
ncbi:hypothetical protein HLH36_02600 [Gluconacetobacter aggeris]|uniref:Uncharacterized protein n=1 Tax=Gluconacetobacter aggeris TaxID=1286186 RepID=A0A7W4IQL3_9PROT|nr:hypothetical protein [Gluconacetobacter aggeris]MBB2167256.1 hypothetical protein [Gluconacetobacter aggeris]